jgi:hypothetical protein
MRKCLGRSTVDALSGGEKGERVCWGRTELNNISVFTV